MNSICGLRLVSDRPFLLPVQDGGRVTSHHLVWADFLCASHLWSVSIHHSNQCLEHIPVIAHRLDNQFKSKKRIFRAHEATDHARGQFRVS